jgi:hypothetical protein
MATKTRYAIPLLGAACTLLATPGPSANAQIPSSDREISETFVFSADRHTVIGNMDIQPGAGGRTWTGRLNSVMGDMMRSQLPDDEFAEGEGLIRRSPSPMVIELQHPEIW